MTRFVAVDVDCAAAGMAAIPAPAATAALFPRNPLRFDLLNLSSSLAVLCRSHRTDYSSRRLVLMPLCRPFCCPVFAQVYVPCHLVAVHRPGEIIRQSRALNPLRTAEPDQIYRDRSVKISRNILAVVRSLQFGSPLFDQYRVNG